MMGSADDTRSSPGPQIEQTQKDAFGGPINKVASNVEDQHEDTVIYSADLSIHHPLDPYERFGPGGYRYALSPSAESDSDSEPDRDDYTWTFDFGHVGASDDRTNSAAGTVPPRIDVPATLAAPSSRIEESQTTTAPPTAGPRLDRQPNSSLSPLQGFLAARAGKDGSKRHGSASNLHAPQVKGPRVDERPSLSSSSSVNTPPQESPGGIDLIPARIEPAHHPVQSSDSPLPVSRRAQSTTDHDDLSLFIDNDINGLLDSNLWVTPSSLDARREPSEIGASPSPSASELVRSPTPSLSLANGRDSPRALTTPVSSARTSMQHATSPIRSERSSIDLGTRSANGSDTGSTLQTFRQVVAGSQEANDRQKTLLQAFNVNFRLYLARCRQWLKCKQHDREGSSQDGSDRGAERQPSSSSTAPGPATFPVQARKRMGFGLSIPETVLPADAQTRDHKMDWTEVEIKQVKEWLASNVEESYPDLGVHQAPSERTRLRQIFYSPVADRRYSTRRYGSRDPVMLRVLFWLLCQQADLTIKDLTKIRSYRRNAFHIQRGYFLDQPLGYFRARLSEFAGMSRVSLGRGEATDGDGPDAGLVEGLASGGIHVDDGNHGGPTDGLDSSLDFATTLLDKADWSVSKKSITVAQIVEEKKAFRVQMAEAMMWCDDRMGSVAVKTQMDSEL